MSNSGNVCEVSNKGVDQMLPLFQVIKYKSEDFTINKIPQGCVGKVDGFKWSDTVITSICGGSSDDIVINPTLDVLSAITRVG